MALISILSLSMLLVAARASHSADLVVGSKNFEESRLLAEIFAQLIEARTDLVVERKLGLAGTQFAFDALRTGAIDLYPEYTGTGWVTILGNSPDVRADQLRTSLRAQFLRQFDLHWLGPLGFENAYELALPRALASELGVRTISDLAIVAGDLRAGVGYEFIDRQDGLPGLRVAYGLDFKSVQAMLQAPKYQAVASRRIDVLDVYTTDGRLLTHDLVVLEDDKNFFPPYEAMPLARGQAVREHPQAFAALGLLAGALSSERMRALNLELQENKREEAEVAREALVALGLVARRPGDGLALSVQNQRTPNAVDDVSALRAPKLRSPWWRYAFEQRHYVARLTGQHIVLCAIALALGILVALPLALWLQRSRASIAEGLIRVVGATQTIPSLALLGLLIPLLGIGTLPALVALWIYSIFPILRGAYSGLRDADPEAVRAGQALGMTPSQVLRSISLPLSMPAIMAGVRTAAVITVGTATVAAFIGAGGLGEPIISGVQLVDGRRVLLGAIPAAVLALAVDLALGRVEIRLRPPGPKRSAG